jgi:hypothetical protein
MDIKFTTDKRFSVQTPVTLEVAYGRGMRQTAEAVQAEARLVEKAASEASGLRVKLNVVFPDGEAAGPRPREREADQALNEPGVRKFVDFFKGSVVSVEKTRAPREEE